MSPRPIDHKSINPESWNQGRLDAMLDIARSAREPKMCEVYPSEPPIHQAAHLGIFPSAFNPPTLAHLAIIERALTEVDLDALLLVVGVTNADKGDTTHIVRRSIAMLEPLIEGAPQLGLGLSSHPYFPDMLFALRSMGIDATVSFIVGFDTLKRILDPEGRYFPHYFNPAKHRMAALERFFADSSCVVAGRDQHGASDLDKLLEDHQAETWRPSIRYLSMPDDCHTISSTDVRLRSYTGKEIHRLVPRSVADYIETHRLYGKSGNQA